MNSISNLSPQALRQRVLSMADTVARQDGSAADKASESGEVKLRGQDLPVDGYGDRLLDAKASFDAQGPVNLVVRSAHRQGMGGQFQAKMSREGDSEKYTLEQRGYHNQHAFRSEFTYNPATDTFTNVSLREGEKSTGEALKENFSPAHLFTIGLGIPSGLAAGALMGLAPAGLAACVIGSVVMMAIGGISVAQRG